MGHDGLICIAIFLSNSSRNSGGAKGKPPLYLNLQPRPQAQPLPLRAVAWVLRGKHSRKRAVRPGRKCRKKCMIQ